MHAIQFNQLDEKGAFLAIWDDQVGRTDLAAAVVAGREMIERGVLRGVIIDASQAGLYDSQELAEELWVDGLAALPEGFPIAYVGPPGFRALREKAIRSAAVDWGQDVEIFDDRQSAVSWLDTRLS
ncbi:hypothetical protein [Maricaulis sp.]|uniref:hypothetical protein n=1 Tax=Maricaulis sp. TaxID=1486257 RepID=UPI0026392E73|nr:hypothetical protein [Maricaulis sp.]